MTTRIEAFEFLDALRESGVTNMYGARPYVQEEFGIGREEAGRLCSEWMKSFSRDKTAAERAAQFD